MKITPHHNNNFPHIPKHTMGLEIMEHLRLRGKSHSGGNRHHLFFEEERFKSDVILRALRENPFCIAVIPRPWHILLHQRFSHSPIPDREVALGFLDEAAVIERWIRRTKLAHDIITGKGSNSLRAQEKHLELTELAALDALRVTQSEVMPADMRFEVIEGMGRLGLDGSPLLASLPTATIATAPRPVIQLAF